MNPSNIYPRTGDAQTVYLNQVVTDPSIIVGNYTMYNDFVHDTTDFEKNNVLYHYPVNHDRLVIGKFCSIACGAKFLFNSANHSLQSLSNYPFPSSSRNGDWTVSRWPTLGTTRVILSSETMCGSATRRSSWRG